MSPRASPLSRRGAADCRGMLGRFYDFCSMPLSTGNFIPAARFSQPRAGRRPDRYWMRTRGSAIQTDASGRPCRRCEARLKKWTSKSRRRTEARRTQTHPGGIERERSAARGTAATAERIPDGRQEMIHNLNRGLVCSKRLNSTHAGTRAIGENARGFARGARQSRGGPRRDVDEGKLQRRTDQGANGHRKRTHGMEFGAVEIPVLSSQPKNPR